MNHPTPGWAPSALLVSVPLCLVFVLYLLPCGSASVSSPLRSVFVPHFFGFLIGWLSHLCFLFYSCVSITGSCLVMTQRNQIVTRWSEKTDLHREVLINQLFSSPHFICVQSWSRRNERYEFVISAAHHMGEQRHQSREKYITHQSVAKEGTIMCQDSDISFPLGCSGCSVTLIH